MLGTTHSIANAAAWLTAVTISQIATGQSQITPAIVGTSLVVGISRLPDVDNPDSVPGRNVNKVIPGLPAWLDRVFGHRKSPLHWGGSAILAGALISVLALQFVPSFWWTGLAVGGSWFLHVAGDCLTWQGAPLLAPVSFHMVRPRYGRRFQCGGRFERRIILPVVTIWCCAASIIASLGFAA